MLVIGSDHGGLELKKVIKELLVEREIAFTDLGTDNNTSVDYPDFGERVARAVATGKAQQGVLICGTGIGMSIVANKFPGVRAALVHDPFTAQMAKEHNNANIIVLGGRVLQPEAARAIFAAWLDTDFAGDRHQRRLDKIARIENEICSGKF